MSPVYPRETKKLHIISHLEEIRRRILVCLLALVTGAVAAFWFGDRVMLFVKKPILDLADELIFISPTEAFVAYLKVAILSGFIVSFPLILYNIWAFLVPALSEKVNTRVVCWLVFALFLFFGGIAFSFFLRSRQRLIFCLVSVGV